MNGKTVLITGAARTWSSSGSITDRAALDDAVARGVERFGGIDAVFANAGSSGSATS